MRHAVRIATSADTQAIAAMLDRAFADDPFVRWLVRRDRQQRRARRRYFDLVLHRLTLPHRSVWTVDKALGAALWVPPGKWELGLAQQLRLLPEVFRIVGLRRYGPMARALHVLESRRPAEPWYFLALLGTEPSAQGQGIASALLAPVLERCDRDGVGAVLDTTVERNLLWYERHGFIVTSEMRLPDGPTCWTMLRPAGGAHPAADRRLEA